MTLNRMKYLLWGVCAAYAGYAACAEDARRLCPIAPGRAEIVVGKDAAKPVEFAAAELNGIFARAFGSALPVVNVPTPGKTSIFLGDCGESRAAGVSVENLPRDSFTVKVGKDRVFIAGRDDPKCDLDKEFVGKGRVINSEHATLFGVYHFLERYFGVRFYFPGDIGTVVPKTALVNLPVGEETHSPVFTVRNVYFHGDGVVPGETDEAYRRSWKALSWLRLRMQTQSIPCCHGQRGFTFPERFHKTHPEYFALLKRDKKTLKRDVAEHQVSDCDVQMCHSSGLWDVMYEDCKAYLTGQPASSRGICRRRWGVNDLGWNNNCVGRFIDVMPQDGMPQCLCDTCQLAYDKTSKNFATELIWGNTAKLAGRLNADGLDCIITQMAYPPYRDIPKCELPSNVWVMVAETGPWSEACPGEPEREIDEIRAWSEKLGHKIWMWTYPSKFGKKATPGVPDMAPRAWAKFYKRTLPYSYGSFCESECEKSIFHYLNYYMFSRIAWDGDVDVEAVLEEHFRLMFGAAADELARFYGELEEKWTKETLFRWHDYAYGGKTFSVSSDVRLWRVVYSPEVRARWTSLFDEAEKKVACDPDALRRVRFVRSEFLDYMKTFAEKFEARADPEKGRAHYRSLTPKTNLIPMQTEPKHCVLTDFRKWAGVKHSLKGKIKPKTKYRISALIRLKNAIPAGPHHNGCGYFECYAGGWHWFPSAQAAFCGTFDWTYCSYEFETPGRLGTNEEDHVGFAFGRGTGEAWVDCFSVEELNDKKED